MDFYSEIISEIKKGKAREIHSLKANLSKKYKIKMPTNIEILMHADEKDIPKLKILSGKETRTQSGVVPVAVMTKPSRCPHGKCIMCPGGIKSYFGNVPQSYTGHEPATMRAIRAKFDSYIQIFNRLEQYVLLGHPIDKIELIIMGGTFPAEKKKYQEEFVVGCFKAMNDFSELFFNSNELNLTKFKEFFELPRNAQDNERYSKIQAKIAKFKGKLNLEKEKTRNEIAKARCIGMTIETRPDWGFAKQGNEMLKWGCTRVELGVQTIYDDILKKIKRGHTIKDTIKSIKELKDLGFKLNFHFMIGLPGMSKQKDIFAMKELFENPNYRPDMLKIYPCMVSKGTVLYNQMKKGKYEPITTQEAAEIISEGKRFVEKYCRIMRIQRDIPPKFMEAGVDRSNLRQYVDELLKKKGIKCKCIRCREHGLLTGKEKVIYHLQKYESSNGKEFFFSADTKQDAILGFARMRYPSSFLRKEITKDSALIREIHVYGNVVPIGEKGDVQHKGIGKQLMELAEKQAEKDGKNKIVVISGVGAREYYRKIGYRPEGPYMVKKI
ncbi:tRNA uridine(34) 5-carboxymethylaminomethyl modification radical SAM/GNAT enzyme Elp3 [Candidatus Woesearchaeota archaeon]|nr:tRNA uridine(34) 5-carboxymethylaminomethyl modification radical SAM/GNAT enzyme Elp3 [Candidatus Woesearchaeota archaeon]